VGWKGRVSDQRQLPCGFGCHVDGGIEGPSTCLHSCDGVKGPSAHEWSRLISPLQHFPLGGFSFVVSPETLEKYCTALGLSLGRHDECC
jgi:hypothetical protein